MQKRNQQMTFPGLRWLKLNSHLFRRMGIFFIILQKIPYSGVLIIERTCRKIEYIDGSGEKDYYKTLLILKITPSLPPKPKSSLKVLRIFRRNS